MTNLFDFFQKKGASDTKQGTATTNTARANPKRSATTLAASAKVKESSDKKQKITSSSLVASAPSDEDTEKNKRPTKNPPVVAAPTKQPPVTKSSEKDKNDVDDMILDPPKLRHAAIIGNRRNLNGKNAMASFPGRSKKRESGDEMVSDEEESDGGGKETDDDETTPVVFKYPIGTSIKKVSDCLRAIVFKCIYIYKQTPDDLLSQIKCSFFQLMVGFMAKLLVFVVVSIAFAMRMAIRKR